LGKCFSLKLSAAVRDPRLLPKVLRVVIEHASGYRYLEMGNGVVWAGEGFAAKARAILSSPIMPGEGGGKPPRILVDYSSTDPLMLVEQASQLCSALLEAGYRCVLEE